MVAETFVVPAHSEKQAWESGWRRVPTALPFGLSPRVIPWLTVIPGGMWTLASSHPVLRSSEEHLLRFADETGKKIHHLGP